jgi:putative DNA primase/helicase
MLNFQNGVLDIETNKFESGHTKERGFRYCLPYDYDPKAKAPVFEAMLDRITCGDESLKKILLEFMGYALSDDSYWLHKALVMVGTGSNGKSTFIKTLTKLVGKDSYSTIRIGDLKHEYSRQLLDGKLFNISEETPNNALVASDIFKDVTSGGELQVREPYKSPYKMVCKAKIILTCNDMPSVSDTSQGFYRRLLIVPFRAEIDERGKDFDPQITEKLDAELPGILNMALKAYKRVRIEKSFSRALASETYLERYKLDSDPLKRWFQENVDPCKEEGSFIPFQDLYDDYVNYVRGWNEDVWGYQRFMMKIRTLIPDFDNLNTRKQINGARYRGISNYRCGPGQGTGTNILAFPNGAPMN